MRRTYFLHTHSTLSPNLRSVLSSSFVYACEHTCVHTCEHSGINCKPLCPHPYSYNMYLRF